MAMLGFRCRIAPSPDFSRSSRRVPCSDHIVISEQRFDFLTSLPRVGGETSLLMEDDAHFRINTTGFGETFRQEP